MSRLQTFSSYLGIPFSHEYFWNAKIGLVIMTPPRSNITSFIILNGFCFFLQVNVHQTTVTRKERNLRPYFLTEASSGRWSADAFPIGIDVKRFLIGLRIIANRLLFYILHRKYRKMADELPDDFDVIVLGTGMLYDQKCSNVVNLMQKFTRFRN